MLILPINDPEAARRALSAAVSVVPNLPTLAAMNPEQAAKYCGVGINAMRQLFRAGAIPARRSGRRWIVRREALDEWIRSQEDVEHRERLDLLASGRGRRDRVRGLRQYSASIER